MKVRSIIVAAALLVASVSDGALEPRQATPLAIATSPGADVSFTGIHAVPEPWSDGRGGAQQAAADGRDLVVMLLLDLTASMHRYTYKFRGSMYRNNDTALPNYPTLKSNELRALVDRFAEVGRPGERFSVSTFREHVEFGRDFTGDRNALRASGRTRLAIPDRDISRYGPSPIWDALNAAVEALKPLPGRRSVVLVTDGKASGNHLGVDDVAHRAAEAGVIINVIGVQPDYDQPQADGSTITVRPSVFLQRLAAATGGTFVLHRDNDWIPRQLDDILMQLRRQ